MKYTIKTSAYAKVTKNNKYRKRIHMHPKIKKANYQERTYNKMFSENDSQVDLFITWTNCIVEHVPTKRLRT